MPFDHGPRLSLSEYERRVVDLQSRQPEMPTPDEDRRHREAELDLTIDFRLGTRFPADRRGQLHVVARAVERHRILHALKSLVTSLLPGRRARAGGALARHVVDAYATVLTEEELDAYFGPDEVRRPALPFDEETAGGGETGR